MESIVKRIPEYKKNNNNNNNHYILNKENGNINLLNVSRINSDNYKILEININNNSVINKVIGYSKSNLKMNKTKNTIYNHINSNFSEIINNI